MNILDILWPFFGLDILIIYVSRKWARSKNRCDSRNINNTARLGTNTELLRTVLSELKCPGPLALVKDILIDILVVKIDNICLLYTSPSPRDS